MADLSVKYLSLELKNPCIIASSPLTSDIDGLVRCEKAGAGAVVLKSIFEEQITSQVEKELDENEQYLTHADAVPYFEKISKDYYINRYLDLVRKAKKELSVPVIASVNCTDADAWTEYIRSFEAAGADALELNYYPMSADWRTEGSRVDRLAADFAARVRSACSIPVSVKIGCEYSSLAWIIRQMDHSGVDGLVLFNRFYRPDIDIENMTLTKAANPLSSADEYAESLRWIALMSAEVRLDLAAATGIHSGETVIKMLLAGASAVQICSAAIKDLGVIAEMNSTLEDWMNRHGFSTVSEFRGKLAQENMSDGSRWERVQYIKKLMGE